MKETRWGDIAYKEPRLPTKEEMEAEEKKLIERKVGTLASEIAGSLFEHPHRTKGKKRYFHEGAVYVVVVKLVQ